MVDRYCTAMEKLFIVVLIALVCFSATNGKKKSKYGKWNYERNGQYGPKNWGTIRGGSQCLGSQQSPIDINTMRTIEQEFPKFKFTNYDSNGRSGNARPTQMSNNGKIVKILLEGDYFVTGGGLPSRFKAAQMHFHWGADWTRGSEHTIDGQPVQGELHILHFDSLKYRNIGAAIKQPDGLAILGFRLKMGQHQNHAWDAIIRPLNSIRYVGTAFDFTQQPFVLSNILPHGNKLRKFYRYKGSLTTPGCYESVIWTVFHDPIELSEQQLEKFRALTSVRAPTTNVHGRNRGGADTEEDLIGSNYRPIQPHNWRPVYKSFENEEGSEYESEYESPESDVAYPAVDYPDYGPRVGAGGTGTGNTAGGAGTGAGAGTGGVANYNNPGFYDQYIYEMYGMVGGTGTGTGVGQTQNTGQTNYYDQTGTQRNNNNAPDATGQNNVYGQQAGANSGYGTGQTNYDQGYNAGQTNYDQGQVYNAGQTNYYGQQTGGNSGQEANFNYGYGQGLDNQGMTGQTNYYGQQNGDNSGEDYDYGGQTNYFNQGGNGEQIGTGHTNYGQGGQGQTNNYDNNNNGQTNTNPNANEPALQGVGWGNQGGFGPTAGYGNSFNADYFGPAVTADPGIVDPFTDFPVTGMWGPGSNPGVGGSRPGVGRGKPGYGGSKPSVGGGKPGRGGSQPGFGGPGNRGSQPGFGNPGAGGSRPGFGGIEPTVGGTAFPQFLDTNQNVGGQVPDPYQAGHKGLETLAKMWQQLMSGKKANPDDAAYYNADFNPAELNNNDAPGNFNEIENNYDNYGNGNYGNEPYQGMDNPYFV